MEQSTLVLFRNPGYDFGMTTSPTYLGAGDGLLLAEPWTDQTGREWNVIVQWASVGTRWEPVGLRLAPRVQNREDLDKLRAVDTELLRELPLGTIHRLMREALIEAAGRAGLPDWVEELERPKTRRLDMDELGQVAEIYRSACSVGANPVEAVAKRLHMPKSTAAKRVMKARAAGLLPPTEPRKAKA